MPKKGRRHLRQFALEKNSLHNIHTMKSSSNKDDNENNDIQIIGQGSYGCIYRPNVGCATKKPESKEHLSKIQRLDRTTAQ